MNSVFSEYITTEVVINYADCLNVENCAFIDREFVVSIKFNNELAIIDRSFSQDSSIS